jgi:RNA polymerase sigma factor (sigma-70 family)
MDASCKLHPRDQFGQTNPTLFLRLNGQGAIRELAWEEFHRAYAPIIAGFARKLGAPKAEVEDVVQEVMTGFYSTSPRFVYDPQRGRFRGFLKVCTLHAVAKRFGGQARFNQVPIEQVDPNWLTVDSAWSDIWEQEIFRRALEETKSQYSRNAATERTFQAFVEYVMREKTAEEVAQSLGLQIGSVHMAKIRVTRTLTKVVAELRDQLG